MALIAASATEQINVAFLLVIAFVTALAICGLRSDSRKSLLGRIRDVAPGLLTGIGLFGTFLGIFLGLLHFDVENIQAGVPALLGGMKTKFFTSVSGLFAALLVKVLVVAFTPNRVTRGAAAADVVTA